MNKDKPKTFSIHEMSMVANAANEKYPARKDLARRYVNKRIQVSPRLAQYLIRITSG